MYYLDTLILAKQLLPPNWRDARLSFVVVLLFPFKSILNDFENYRRSAKLRLNLTAQVIVVENHIRKITGLNYGVYISDTSINNEFNVNLPVSAFNHKNEIEIFLKKIIPAGKKYQLIFY